MIRELYVGQPEETPLVTVEPAPFTEGFGNDEWKYVGFSIGDIFLIKLEIGSKIRNLTKP